MDGFDFYIAVRQHPLLRWDGVQEGATPAADAVLVSNEGTGTRWSVTVRAIKDGSWRDLQAVLLGIRPATVIRKYARSGAYYANVDMLDASRRAEIRARRKHDVPTTLDLLEAA